MNIFMSFNHTPLTFPFLTQLRWVTLNSPGPSLRSRFPGHATLLHYLETWASATVFHVMQLCCITWNTAIAGSWSLRIKAGTITPVHLRDQQRSCIDPGGSGVNNRRLFILSALADKITFQKLQFLKSPLGQTNVKKGRTNQQICLDFESPAESLIRCT